MRRARRRKPLVGGLLAIALTAVVLAGFAWARGRAEARGRLLRVGTELGTLAPSGPAPSGPAPSSEAREVELNGARLVVRSVTTSLDVRAAVRSLARRCVAGELELEELATIVEIEGRDPGLLDPVLHWHDDAQGFVGCLQGEARAVRYVYATRRGDRTTLVGVASEGALDAARLFPTHGDAPGRDLPGVPRPAGMHRTLSFAERGEPYGMAVYRGAARDVEALRAEYRAMLERAGWAIEGRAGSSLHARAEDARLVITFSTDVAGSYASALMSRETDGQLGRAPWSVR